MKKDKFLKCILILLLPMAFFAFWSCNDEWEDHYSEEVVSGQTIIDYINSRSDLSIFAEYLDSTGYDDVLAESQSYTVWVPNNDALNDTSFSEEAMENIVKNHIARGRITTTKSVNAAMLNGKNVSMTVDENGFKFGDGDMLDVNKTNSNGLVHVISEYAPYLNNLYEYLDEIEGLDSLRDYIYSYQTTTFDPEGSVELGVDDLGQAVYDSSFIYENEILDIIGGNIDLEDSVYTAIYPNNTAWDEAYARIAQYVVLPPMTLNPDGSGDLLYPYYGGDDRARYLIQLYIVRDMLYSGRIENPEDLDSLTSTTGNVYHDPAALFAGTDMYEASNGILHVANQLPFDDSTLFLRERRVEAESSTYRITDDDQNCKVTTNSIYGTDLNVSNDKYIKVTPVGTGSGKPSVTFAIPSIYATKYKVYCVFAPLNIVDSEVQKSTRAKFALTWYRTSSTNPRRKTLSVENNVTNKNGMTKMYLGEITSYAANLYGTYDEETYSDVSVKLKIQCDVTKDEAEAEGSELSRNMLIDCIIFEPVIE